MGENSDDQGQLEGEAEGHHHLEDKADVLGKRPLGANPEPFRPVDKKADGLGQDEEITETNPAEEEAQPGQESRDKQVTLLLLQCRIDKVPDKKGDERKRDDDPGKKADLQRKRQRVHRVEREQEICRILPLLLQHLEQRSLEEGHDEFHRGPAHPHADDECHHRFNQRPPQLLEMIEKAHRLFLFFLPFRKFFFHGE